MTTWRAAKSSSGALSLTALLSLAILISGAGCSKDSNSAPSGQDSAGAPVLGPSGTAKKVEATLRNLPITDPMPAQRVGRGPNNTVWVSSATQVALIDLTSGETLHSLNLPFEVYQDRDLISNGRSMALLRSDAETSNELATVDTSTLALKTFKLGAMIGKPNALSFTRDLSLVAVNNDTGVRFLGRNPTALAFDVFKAELTYPKSFSGAGTEMSSGTLISRNSNWAVTPIRRDDLKEGGLFLMDLFTRKTSIVFRMPAPRKGMLVDAPSVYGFSDDSAYLIGQPNLQAGTLSVYDLRAAKMALNITVNPTETTVIDSLSQPQIVNGRVFCNVTLFDPDASDRTSQINVYDLATGDLITELKLPETINSYAVLTDHRVVAVAPEHLFVFDY